MQTTFILAQHFGVTPFDIMRQDLEAVVMVVNYLVACGSATRKDNNENNALTEKENDRAFWSAF